MLLGWDIFFHFSWNGEYVQSYYSFRQNAFSDTSMHYNSFWEKNLFFQEHWNRRPFMVKSAIKHLIADVTDTWWRMLHYQIIFASQKTLRIKVITNAKTQICQPWENWLQRDWMYNCCYLIDFKISLGYTIK